MQVIPTIFCRYSSSFFDLHRYLFVTTFSNILSMELTILMMNMVSLWLIKNFSLCSSADSDLFLSSQEIAPLMDGFHEQKKTSLMVTYHIWSQWRFSTSLWLFLSFELADDFDSLRYTFGTFFCFSQPYLQIFSTWSMLMKRLRMSSLLWKQTIVLCSQVIPRTREEHSASSSFISQLDYLILMSSIRCCSLFLFS